MLFDFIDTRESPDAEVGGRVSAGKATGEEKLKRKKKKRFCR
jgi:hypothetical protein